MKPEKRNERVSLIKRFMHCSINCHTAVCRRHFIKLKNSCVRGVRADSTWVADDALPEVVGVISSGAGQEDGRGDGVTPVSVDGENGTAKC